MMKLLGITSAAAAVLAFACLSMPVHAFTDGACRDDAKKLCGDVKPGGGIIQDCLKQHQADLSQACKDNIAEDKQKRQEKVKEVKEACKQELQQYCANVTPGEGREMSCLKAYSDKLSASCKDKLPKRGMGKGMRHHDKDKGDADHDDGPPSPPDGK